MKYVQAYYDKHLKESEISWVTIGKVYDEDNEVDILGKIQVIFEEPIATISTASKSIGINMDVSVFPRFRMFAFPSGDHKFWVRYSRGGTYTEWLQFTKKFEGGKCYEINDKKHPVGGGFLTFSSDMHNFKVEEASCSRWLYGYKTVELYRLGGYKAMPTVELIKSYDIDDDIFFPFKRKNKNNVTITTIPFEFIRKLYEELE